MCLTTSCEAVRAGLIAKPKTEDCTSFSGYADHAKRKTSTANPANNTIVDFEKAKAAALDTDTIEK